MASALGSPTPASLPPSSVVANRQNGASRSTDSPDQHSHDRLLFLAANFIGCLADVTVASGEQYSGIFSTPCLEPPELKYILKMTKRKTLSADSQQSNGDNTTESSGEYIGVGDDHVMIFQIKDVVDLKIDDVSLDKVQLRAPNGASASFRTDTDISGNASRGERELQRWDSGPPTQSASMSFNNGSSKPWDQFEANERLYGVKSNYDENMYTTSIDRSDPSYHKRAARAEQLAREIEGTATTNIHLAEERGLVDEQHRDVDEEERYSGVKRDFPSLSGNQPNKYTPPARRAPSAQPTVTGAPFDPAIIASQLVRPDSKTAKPSSTQSSDQSPSRTAEMNKDTTNKAAVPVDATKTDPVSSQNEPAPAEEKVAQNGHVAPVTAKAAGKNTSAGPAANATQTVERDVLKSFKDFSASEKLRMQERQRTQQRKEKEVKLNDLKKFSINFKLKTDVPPDMLGILAKDKQKQAEIIEKAKRASEDSKVATPKPTTPSSTDAVSQVSNAITSPAQDKCLSRSGQPGITQGQTAPFVAAGRANVTGNLGQRLMANQKGMPGVAPSPVPSNGPAAMGTEPPVRGPGTQTPNSAASLRFNVQALEFKPNPAASSFSPSQQAKLPASPATTKPPPASRSPVKSSFFGERRPNKENKKPFRDAFNPIKRMKKEAEEDKSKSFTHNGGIPNAYRTPPTWDHPKENAEKGYKEMFEKAMPQIPTASPNNGPLPHQHQLPPHLQQSASSSHLHMQQNPQQAFQQFPQQGRDHHFDDHRMHVSSSASSMYPSPRFQPNMMVQPAPMLNHGQPYGNPNMQSVMLGPDGRPLLLSRPSGSQHYMAPNQPMSTPMMLNHSQGAPFMGMPMPQNMGIYAPGQAQMFGGGPQGPGGPGGYPSPRNMGAPMMMQQGSQQGHTPQGFVVMNQSGPMYPSHGQQMPYRSVPMQQQQSYHGSPQFHSQQARHYQGNHYAQQQPQMNQPPPMPQQPIPSGQHAGTEEVK